MSSLSPVSEALTVFVNAFTAAAAVAGALAAWNGLSTWKKQAKWHRDSELAKSLLVALFERKDAVDRIRSPFGAMSFEALSNPEKRYQEVKEDYSRRLEPLNEARKSYYASGNEAKALWGENLETLSASLVSLEAELIVALEDYIANLQSKASGMADLEAVDLKRIKNVIRGRGIGKDRFGQDYADGVAKIEDYLRGKLAQ